ncbi:hypothetical protein MNBD_ALPHA08-2060 [hydrothermal vent metagenome]|uniref:DUF695 domain-containing protein n=1 Tax=hydrothermal vent metagenome TaxID=652676 RepID=A0A3B0T2C1_9ZZZZ
MYFVVGVGLGLYSVGDSKFQRRKPVSEKEDQLEEHDPWLVAETEEDGMPTVYRVRQNIPDHVVIEEFPHLVCVVWEFEPAVGNGMPGGEVAEQQAMFEDGLDGFIEKGGDCEHMVVVTGNGRKEWLWYVRDPDDWIEGFSEALSDLPPFPVEIQGYDGEGWRAYMELKQALTQSAEALS